MVLSVGALEIFLSTQDVFSASKIIPKDELKSKTVVQP